MAPPLDAIPDRGIYVCVEDKCVFVPVYCFWKVAGGDLVYSRVSGLGKDVTVSPCRRMRDALFF